MIYDLSHQLVDENGDPAKDEVGKPADLKKILSRALLTDTAENAKSKFERFELYLKTKFSELKIDLTAEEVKLLKEASSVYPTLILGQLLYWLDGKSLSKDS